MIILNCSLRLIFPTKNKKISLLTSELPSVAHYQRSKGPQLWQNGLSRFDHSEDEDKGIDNDNNNAQDNYL